MRFPTRIFSLLVDRKGGPRERTANQHWLVGSQSDPTLAEAVTGRLAGRTGPPYKYQLT